MAADCGRALKIRIYMLYEGRLNVIRTSMRPPTIPEWLHQFIFAKSCHHQLTKIKLIFQENLPTPDFPV